MGTKPWNEIKAKSPHNSTQADAPAGNDPAADLERLRVRLLEKGSSGDTFDGITIAGAQTAQAILLADQVLASMHADITDDRRIAVAQIIATILSGMK